MVFAFFALLFILILVFFMIFLKNHKKSRKNDDIIVNLDLSDILIFDTETTGVNPEYEEILELAIINGCGDILFNGRFRPEKRKTWKHAQEINSISPDDVKDCKSITEYLPQLQEIFDKPKIIAGYNVPFDLKFIHAAGIKTHADYVIDVMKQFADERGIYDEEHSHNKWFKLEEAANYYGYQFKPHGALEDCKATLFVLKKIQGID